MGPMHGSDYAKDRNRQLPEGTAHGERDYVTCDSALIDLEVRFVTSGGPDVLNGIACGCYRVQISDSNSGRPGLS